MKTIRVLGVRINDISRVEVSQKFASFLKKKSFQQIATVNPEFLVEAKNNNEFREILSRTALNICDGVGISLVSRVIFGQKIRRITGVEVAEILCKICEQEGKSIYFIGGFGVAESAAKKIKKRYPKLKIAGFEDGDPKHVSNKIISAAPDAVLVAFGAPKQEEWLEKAATKIKSLRIGVGVGGTFDFWAKKTKRSPKILQKIGLEWLWRLILEPRGRGRRIFTAVCIFPFLVIKSLFEKS